MDRVRTRGEEAMARVTHATPHLPIAEVKNRMRTDPHADRRQRWLIIYNASSSHGQLRSLPGIGAYPTRPFMR